MQNQNNLNDIKESELSKDENDKNNHYEINDLSIKNPTNTINRGKRKTVIGVMHEKDKKEKKVDSNKEDFNIAIEEAFNDFDKDGSDFITKDEFGSFMKSLGYQLTEIELEEMIKSVDNDSNGLIGLKEFKRMIASNINDDMNINTSIEAFGIFDKGRTEKINVNVLKELLLKKDKNNQILDFTEEEINDIFKNIDIKENEIDYISLVKSTFDIFATEDV
jgi:Ca2+-binding EF-hand superfamily protein